MTTRILGLIAGLLLLALPVFAQETIDIGDTVEGTLDEGQTIDYTFEAEAGDFLLFSMESDDFDTFLYLLDSEGEELTRNDDGGEGFNSLITYEFEEDGDYTIRAASFDDLGTGDFTLRVEPFEAETIAYGDTIESEDGLPTALYTFQGEAGDVVVARARAEGLDTFVELINPEGVGIADSEFFDGQNARLGPFALPEDGTYTLSVRAEGESSLTLEAVEPTNITLGETIERELTDEINELYYALTVDETGVVVDVIVESDLNTRLDILNPFGFLERGIDDTLESTSPRLDSQALDIEGVYYLVISPSDPAENLVGEVALTVQATEIGTLDDGQVELPFNAERSDQVVTFMGSAGETVTLTMEVDGEASPFLEIAQDDVLIASYGQDNIRRAVLTLDIPADGEVTLTVQVFEEAVVTLTLDRE